LSGSRNRATAWPGWNSAGGKTITDARGDLQGVVNMLRYYGGSAEKVEGRTVPVPGGFLSYTLRQPMGVVGQIVPWNFRLLMLAWYTTGEIAGAVGKALDPTGTGVAAATGSLACQQPQSSSYGVFGRFSSIHPTGRRRWRCEGIVMCRNIKTLFNFKPPATDEEIRAASLQFVRKLSGFNKPSSANAAAFARAVEDVAAVARRLIDSLSTTAPPRDRQIEAEKARANARRRFAK
jgi:hypothetical protein